MNHEYKYTLLENESEYKDSVLKEIENITDENELLKFIDKIISIQYYKGIFNDSDEYDELLSDIISDFYENESEFKYFLFKLLESYDIYLTDENLDLDEDEIELTTEIKIDYLINNLDSDYYLDEISPDYIDEIYIYESKYDLIDSINELISCYIPDMKFNFKTKSYESWLLNYFNYDEYISDLVFNDEYIEYKYKYEIRYIQDMNKYPYI